MLRLCLLLGMERFASPLRAETSALFVHATSREKHELVEFCFKHDILCLRKKTKCHSEMCAVVYFKGFVFSCNNVTRVCSKSFKTIIKVLGKDGSTDTGGCGGARWVVSEEIWSAAVTVARRQEIRSAGHLGARHATPQKNSFDNCSVNRRTRVFRNRNEHALCMGTKDDFNCSLLIFVLTSVTEFPQALQNFN